MLNRLVSSFHTMEVRSIGFLLLAALVLSGCNSPEPGQTVADEAMKTSGPLPSWNHGETRTAIISFVEGSVEQGNVNFIPVPERIACIDNDGTLWAEQPVYFQFIYAKDFIEQNAANHPEWASKQ